MASWAERMRRQPQQREALPPGHYGMKFLPVDTTSGPLAAAIKTAEANKEKVQRFTGTIGEVCTKKGCWFVLQDGTQQARVMMRGVLENDTKYFEFPLSLPARRRSLKEAHHEGLLRSQRETHRI